MPEPQPRVAMERGDVASATEELLSSFVQFTDKAAPELQVMTVC